MLPDQQAILEQAKNFESLKRHPGWLVLEDLLLQWERDAVDDLLSYQGSDAILLRAKQLSVRSTREIRMELNRFMDDTIQQAKYILAENAVSEEL